jgi:hypothetical protein
LPGAPALSGIRDEIDGRVRQLFAELDPGLG